MALIEFDRLRRPGAQQRLLAVLVAVALLALAWHFNVKPRAAVLSPIPDTLRALLATVLVFGLGGFGLVRMLLPARLRELEVLWILPTGGCAVGLAMTLLGFAAVPYPVALTLVLLAGAAAAVLAVRRRGWPEFQLPSIGWPVYLALGVLLVTLTPMLFIQHYAAPVGTGSDAHVATGTATFLKHAYPTATDISLPIDQMPPLWLSKYPIYYVFAAVSTVSGLDTWQVLAPLAGALLALAAVGMFLLAKEVFKAPTWAALMAMALAGLDRMALHTVLHPYFNQTWGFFSLPFTIVLGWWAMQPGLTRQARGAALLLLAMFSLVLVLAYPLAAPIPAVPLAVFAWSDWRRRVRGGQSARLRERYRGPRSLLWIVPVCVLLAAPVAAAVQKGVSAAQVLAPGSSLRPWAADLLGFIPFDQFLSLPAAPLGSVLVVVVAGLCLLGLRSAPRELAVGLGGLLLFGLVIAVYLRHRRYGYYFHFKLLAFIAPLILLIAVVGAGRLRRAGPALVAVLALCTAGSIVSEVRATGYQLPKTTIELASWARALPEGASVRLDIPPGQQLWVAYFLTSRRVCSQVPLLGTDYPHVGFSRKADYILAPVTVARPADAVGAPLRQNQGLALYRESPKVPSPDLCTRRRFDRLYTGIAHTPF